MATTPRDARFTSDNQIQLFTRLDTKDRGSENPRLPARATEGRQQVRGADDGKGKLLSQVGDKN
jgi:hypothetical protein